MQSEVALPWEGGPGVYLAASVSAWTWGKAYPAAWRDDYNQVRPHTSLSGLTPNEYARLFQAG
ncbi:integrase core domain-containing protein [Deinococcus marmoris]|uniref:integrase core domain-containing protein n=1 Tax=Deinococcus marmoris TaxID=249408 RepID=UPI000AD3ACD3